MKSLTLIRSWLLVLIVWLILAGCERPDPAVTVVAPAQFPPTPLVTPFAGSNGGVPRPFLQSDVPHPTYDGTPTPDPPHGSGDAVAPLTHTVNAGETLGYIAQLYGSSVEELQAANQLAGADFLAVGQVLQIPNQITAVSPALKIIPDSELVYGPAARDFDVRDYVSLYNGRLLTYGEEVEGRYLEGPEIVQLVAERHSVNPRLLLAMVEYWSEWVTQTAVADAVYPLGHEEPHREGLYRQLSWAANLLNWGYYGRAEGGVTSFRIDDGVRLAFAPTINHGTAGAQALLAARSGATYDSWQQDVGPNGLLATYTRMFGNPFAYTVDPLLPTSVSQPALRLPFPGGETWRFTGGPHGGWNTGSAWAALDFAPEDALAGCVQSEAWVTAMADGVVTRSDMGAVVVDMDGDGYAGTGWAILYMHLATRDRIPAGTVVQAGDRLGHPSCEGGFANALHLHVARTYNGRWVAADGPIPFEMSGWVSQGLGREYDGLLTRGGQVIEACDGCRDGSNAITAD